MTYVDESGLRIAALVKEAITTSYSVRKALVDAINLPQPSSEQRLMIQEAELHLMYAERAMLTVLGRSVEDDNTDLEGES